jgi:hypothetical protein
MIGHQRPGIDAGVCTGSKLSQTLDKIFAVGNIIDNSAPFDSSHHHMMQGSRRIQSGSTRHRIPPIQDFIPIT